MNCGHGVNEITKILDKYNGRKTIPKSVAIKMLKLFADSVHYIEHMPGCYLPGQTPPKLCKEHIKENVLIKEFNDGVNKELARVVNHKFDKIDRRKRYYRNYKK